MGSNLVEALKGENTIYGLDIINPSKDCVEKTSSWDDLAGTIPEIDAIIHLAGKAHDTKNKSAADVYFKVNTELTQKIFDWYLANPTVKKFIQFSTVKSAADRVSDRGMHPNTCRSLWGIEDCGRELYHREVCSRGAEASVP